MSVVNYYGIIVFFYVRQFVGYELEHVQYHGQ